MAEFTESPNSKPDAGNPFVAVPIEIMVVVGKARPLIQELVGLGDNSVLKLDKSVEDPVELYVGDKLVARGQLEELDGDKSGQLAVRLIEISDLQHGLG